MQHDYEHKTWYTFRPHCDMRWTRAERNVLEQVFNLLAAQTRCLVEYGHVESLKRLLVQLQWPIWQRVQVLSKDDLFVGSYRICQRVAAVGASVERDALYIVAVPDTNAQQRTFLAQLSDRYFVTLNSDIIIPVPPLHDIHMYMIARQIRLSTGEIRQASPYVYAFGGFNPSDWDEIVDRRED